LADVSIIGLSKKFRISSKPKWVFNLDLKRWFEERMRGETLHLCCGLTHFDNAVNIDIDPNAEADIVADMFNLPVRHESFDTVICDPPYRLAIDKRALWVRCILEPLKKRRGSRILLKTDFIPYFGPTWTLKELVVYQGGRYWAPVSLLLYYEWVDPTIF